MKLLVLSALVAVASCQFLLGGYRGEHVGIYLFQYHSSHQLLLARSGQMCVLVPVDKSWEDQLKSEDSRMALEREIAKMIDLKQMKTADLSAIRSQYHDFLALAECIRHDIYTLAYMPPSN